MPEYVYVVGEGTLKNVDGSVCECTLHLDVGTVLIHCNGNTYVC